LAGLDEDELEALEGELIEDEEAVPGTPPTAESQVLLDRARRLLASTPTDDDLREAIVNLETRLRGDDAAAIDAAQETLLDRIYDRDES
jgi:hypothetical protein